MDFFNSTVNWTMNSTEMTPSVTFPFPPSGYNMAHIIVWSIVVGLIVIGIVFGNSLVCISVVRVRALKGTQYRFLVSLALADLMVGILIIPLSITNELLGCWVFGTFLCLMWKVVDVLACTASILNLCLISLDRYYSITRPIKYAKWRTHRRAYFMIGAVWTLSFIISVPPLFGWRNDDRTVNGYFLCEVSKDPGYVLYSSMGSFFIPAIVMVFVYIRIWRAAKRHARTSLGQGIGDPRPSQAGNCGRSTAYELVDTDEASSQAASAMLRLDKNRNSQNEGRRSPQEPPGDRDGILRFANNSMLSPNSASADLRRRTSSCDYREVERKRRKVAQARERRATVVLGIIMGSFLACWYPFFQLYTIDTVCGKSCNIPTFLFTFVFWIGYCNSALNPLIYTIFNRDFRKAFKKVLGIGR